MRTVTNDLVSLSAQEVKERYNIKESDGWTVDNAKKDLLDNGIENTLIPNFL